MDGPLTVKGSSGPIILQSPKKIGFVFLNLPVETENPAAQKLFACRSKHLTTNEMWKKQGWPFSGTDASSLCRDDTRAELKLYLVGKGREDKLRYWLGTSRYGKLDPEKKEMMDLLSGLALLAIQDVFTPRIPHKAYDSVVTDEDLTTDRLEPLREGFPPRSRLKDVRQSEDIRRSFGYLGKC